MNKFPSELSSIFKIALSTHKKNTLKTSLLTLIYLVLSMLAVAWSLFFLINYPLASLPATLPPIMIIRASMIFLNTQGSILLILIHTIGGISVALSLTMSIMYQRYLYLNTQNVDGQKSDVVFMPFSVFISALLTDVFLMLVSVVGLVFLVFPSFILTVRYKFVRLALISSEKTGFSKLVEVPNAFASSAKIVDGKNTVSTFLYLLAIFVIKHSALLILAIFMFIVGMFVPNILGNGVSAIVIWSVIAIWYVVFMAIGSYMYIVLYLGLSSTSSYGQMSEAANVSENTSTDTLVNAPMDTTMDTPINAIEAENEAKNQTENSTEVQEDKEDKE